jgi:hypothetical protein
MKKLCSYFLVVQSTSESLSAPQKPDEVQGFSNMITVTAIDKSATNLPDALTSTMISTVPARTIKTTATTTTLPVSKEKSK